MARSRNELFSNSISNKIHQAISVAHLSDYGGNELSTSRLTSNILAETN